MSVLYLALVGLFIKAYHLYVAKEKTLLFIFLQLVILKLQKLMNLLTLRVEGLCLLSPIIVIFERWGTPCPWDVVKHSLID